MVTLPAEGRWSIRSLSDDDAGPALAFLRRDPLINDLHRRLGGTTVVVTPRMQRLPTDSQFDRLARRVILALAIGSVSASIVWLAGATRRGLSDFGLVWAAARLLATGVNPYLAIGPHGLGLASSLWYACSRTTRLHQTRSGSLRSIAARG